LKIYCTSKTEAPKGNYRRPEDKFLVDEDSFFIDFKTPYNGGILDVNELLPRNSFKAGVTPSDDDEFEDDWIDDFEKDDGGMYIEVKKESKIEKQEKQDVKKESQKS
jgi:hypothetical protein